ncbi:hypothetical protein ACFFRR_002962 [Megaselia abdita]
MSKEQSKDFSEFDFHDSSSDNSSAQSHHFLNRNRIDAVATPLSPPLTAADEPPLNVVVRPPTPLKMMNGGGAGVPLPPSDNDSSVKGEDGEEDDDDELLEDGSIDKTKTLNVAVKHSTNSSKSKRDSSSKNVRHQHQIFSKNIYIGTKNAEKWERTRTRLAFKNDVEFVTYLLNLTDSELSAPSLPPTTTPTITNFKLEPNLSTTILNGKPEDIQLKSPTTPAKPKKIKKKVQFNEALNGFIPKSKKYQFSSKTNSSTEEDIIPEVLDCRIAEKIKSELEEKQRESGGFDMYPHSEEDEEADGEDDEGEEDGDDEEEGSRQNQNFRPRERPTSSLKKKTVKMNGKLSNSNEDINEGELRLRIKSEEEYEYVEDMFEAVDTPSKPNIVPQTCRDCGLIHEYIDCPYIHNPVSIIDKVDIASWIERRNLENLEKLKNDLKSDESNSNDSEDDHKPIHHMITFAEASIPLEFEFRNFEMQISGVFSKTDIPKFTRLGPLIGQIAQSGDIPPTCDMRYIFEICVNSKSEFISVINPNTSNWLRYIRPAPRYEDRNTNLVCIDNRACFVTCSDVTVGCELLYWSDECNTLWRKKQADKICCGGCNVQFEHPLYYRTHCSFFHDPTFSLTIKKYHCKICGETVIGKENIVKHAAEKHDGKGSRAALQRHAKEVHSRNSAVVSCPRCQKLFQNRSNLKIHMLTHSGVRPFKCAESECTAAFTTKQCLQFHYKKVHNYAPEQMPKIERSVAYTFDAYSGGMKVDYLVPSAEQAPRRRRKSLEDQNSLMSSSIQSDTEYSEDNAYDINKKNSKSLKDICRNETNLSLLSSKMNSMFGKEAGPAMSTARGRKRKQKVTQPNPKDGMEEDDSYDPMEQVRRKQNAQLSLVESFLSTTAQRLSQHPNVLEDVAEKMHAAVTNNELPTDDDNNFHRQIPSNPKDVTNTMVSCQNLVVSKGSKKWISGDDDRMPHQRDCSSVENIQPDPNKLLPNRDFIARFMMNNAGSEGHHHHHHSHHHHQNSGAHEEDENSSFLDVVDSNNPSGGVAGQLPQYHHSAQNEDDDGGVEHGTSQSFMNSFYNNSNSRLTAPGANNSSASLLVEAALNSVGNMIENGDSEIKTPQHSSLDNEAPLNSQCEANVRFGGNGLNNIDSLENEIKMMKGISNFPMNLPTLPIFPNSNNTMSSCNMSPATPNQRTPQNDIDVDANSTPRRAQLSAGGESERYSNHHHQTPPSPAVISPGRDYSMFNNTANGPGSAPNNLSVASPMQVRRGPTSSGTVYPDNELISPASSPAIPRYNFNNELNRKRLLEDERSQNMSVNNQMSSDDENSIIQQNSTPTQDMRMKFAQSQMDLMYSKYESMASAANLKYNNHHQDLEVADYRNNTPSNEMSDLQGLDMSSRSNNMNTNYHHNFQLPTSTASSNLSSLAGRYHHHIYDILSEREQQQQQQQQSQQQQQQQHSQQQDHPNQIPMQQHQGMHNMMSEQMSDQEHDQNATVDLSRTANYHHSSPPPLPYSHAHHDMLRMVSLDLTPNSNMTHGNNRSFLSSQMQHNSREGIDHHRLLQTAEQHRLLAASNPDQHRLLVDPAAHLLMEQNNRLLGSADTTHNNRHMARGFGAYHQVASGNYHHSVRPGVLPSSNHHTPNHTSNYHPFPAYY